MTMTRKTASTLILGLALGLALSMGTAGFPAEAEPTPIAPKIQDLKTYEGREIPAFNQLVLQVLKEYPTDGSHGYWWPRSGESDYDGVSRDIFLKGIRVLKGEEEQRTFCCGLTLEVFMEAYNRWVEKHGEPRGTAALQPQEMAKFKADWFVRDLNGPGPSAALENFNLGKEVPLEEALPGDFVQIWRQPKEGKEFHSGHSVIFLDWERNEAGEPTGIVYWSTNKGIGITQWTEQIGGPDEPGNVATQWTYVGRADVPVPPPVQTRHVDPREAERIKEQSERITREAFGEDGKQMPTPM